MSDTKFGPNYFTVPIHIGGADGWQFQMSDGAPATVSVTTNAIEPVSIPFDEIKAAALGVPDDEAIANILGVFQRNVPSIPDDVLNRARDLIRVWLSNAHISD
jgi:hypothetical protein